MVEEVRPNKDLGQHWLNDEAALYGIVESADLKLSDYVLEIGPGPGSLTRKLLNKAGHVAALELDSALAANLSKEITDPKLEVISGDIRSFNLGLLPQDYVLVANIPYYLSGYILRLLSTTANPPIRAVLLLQKEVAERLLAKPGDLSVLGITTQVIYEIHPGEVIKAAQFTPPPKVDSQSVRLLRRSTPLISKDNEAIFIRTIKIGFSQKRKTLLNSLSSGFRLERQQTVALLNQAGISANARAQELDIADWQRLALAASNSLSQGVNKV